MRTYKDPNGPNRYADPSLGLLGATQRDWLKRELALSRATWKVLAIDLPLGLVVPDGATAQEGVAQGDPGAPLGRELEIADVLRLRPPAGDRGHRDAHRRRALHRGALLRPRARGDRTTSARSGSSSPGR